MTLENKSNNFLLLFPLLLIVAFSICFLLPRLPNLDISVEKTNDIHLNSHPERLEEVNEVRKCTEKHQAYLNPSTGRVACVNYSEKENKWAIRIIERIGDKIEEVTGFLKNKMSSWDQVEQYLNNRGYTVQK